MIVLEKLSELRGGQISLACIYDSCPGALEHEYNLIGHNRFKKFCGLGCSVICLEEYLNLLVK